MSRLAACVLICFCAALHAVHSQEVRTTDPADARFDLVFKGGTVSQLVARVHRSMADAGVASALNISVLPQQAATPVPPLTLQQVSFREVAGFLKKFSTERAQASVEAGRAAQLYGFEQAGEIWFFTVSTAAGLVKPPVGTEVQVIEVTAGYGPDAGRMDEDKRALAERCERLEQEVKELQALVKKLREQK